MSSRCRWQNPNRHGRGALRVALSTHLARAGVEPSPQRDAIVSVFLASKGNETTDEIGAYLAELGLRVAPVMVRDTLRLMAEWSLASLPHCFGRPNSTMGTFVCDACGLVEEFADQDLLEAGLQVALRDHDFAVDAHMLELHGRCDACRATRIGGTC